MSGAEKSILEIMPKIGNCAIPALWDKITQQHVSSITGFVVQI